MNQSITFRLSWNDQWLLWELYLEIQDQYSSQEGWFMFDRGKRSSTHTPGYIEQSAQQSHRCVRVRSAYGPTFTPSTRPIQINVRVAMDHRRYNTSCSTAGTGWKNDNECGQASLHALTSSAFSVTRQWQYKQPR
jgi:hypothetical protein